MPVSVHLPRGVSSNVRTIACLLLAAAVSRADLNEVFARMDKNAASFKGMTADIKQMVHTAVVNDDSTENGTIRLKRASRNDTKILVDFTNPDAKTISVDGQQVRIYLPKANVVQVYDIGNKRAALDQAMLLGFGATSAEIKASYDATWVGEENVNGQPASHIKLIPKSKDVQQQLKQADLWISDSLGAPVQQRLLTSSAGDYTVFAYSNLKFTANPGDLSLHTKKGVQTQQVGK